MVRNAAPLEIEALESSECGEDGQAGVSHVRASIRDQMPQAWRLRGDRGELLVVESADEQPLGFGRHAPNLFHRLNVQQLGWIESRRLGGFHAGGLPMAALSGYRLTRSGSKAGPPEFSSLNGRAANVLNAITPRLSAAFPLRRRVEKAASRVRFAGNLVFRYLQLSRNDCSDMVAVEDLRDDLVVRGRTVLPAVVV